MTFAITLGRDMRFAGGYGAPGWIPPKQQVPRWERGSARDCPLPFLPSQEPNGRTAARGRTSRSRHAGGPQLYGRSQRLSAIWGAALPPDTDADFVTHMVIPCNRAVAGEIT